MLYREIYSLYHRILCVAVIMMIAGLPAWSQPCTTLGQTPSTAFPVCGTTTFQQQNVPLCSNQDPLFVPGCGAGYSDRNPYYYKFTCYVTGTLGFLITPNNLQDDYDWQLYDVTGLNPNEVLTNTNIVVTGNWAGTSGLTGASNNGVDFVQCGSVPADNKNTFSKMPTLTAGRQYILMVSHFTDTQSGYSLSFGGGTAVITDPTEPHLDKASPVCAGNEIRLKLNKKLRCASLTATGSEFSILPALATVVGATTTECSGAFDFEELTITLSNPLPAGDYELVINDGTDGNSLLDHCDRAIPAGERVAFRFDPPIPIFADSIGTPGCAPKSVRIYFPKKIDCSTIAANGSDFSVTGPTPVTVISAIGNCVNGQTDYITVEFSAPIYNKGDYTVTLKTGNDGGTITDECGLESPTHTRTFRAEDTVSAAFSYITMPDCRQNTLTFSHDGAHDVNSWQWICNNGAPITTQQHTIRFPATSTNNVELIVTNGVCSDTSSITVVMDNEVKAGFDMPPVICPEDALQVQNTTEGAVNLWRWNFGTISTSNLKDPATVNFPRNNIEAIYAIKLVATNSTLGCSDSIIKPLKVLNNCFIAVPTAFTPNNDGLNDFLSPNNAVKAENLEFRVYNRWGQLVFLSRDWTKKWDGKVNGVPQDTGVFVWMLSYTHRDTRQQVFQKGTVTLIR